MANRERTSKPVAEGTLPAVTPTDRERLLKGLLRSVSRTFYLTLRVLPRSLREPVGLAYLLARAADTISDTHLLPPHERRSNLLAFRAQVEGPVTVQTLREIGLALKDNRSIAAESTLLNSLPQLFSLLEASPEDDRTRIQSVVVTLTRGMEMDLTTFPSEESGRVVALKGPDELDSYTYYVAGCVGEFWTAMTLAHTPPLKHWDAPHMSELGVRFGKALQLTNVLRDVPKDLRNGRCYLPESELVQVGLTPEELLDPSTSARARTLLLTGIGMALEHYSAAEQYLLAIPRRCLRLRLAVLWPILIGIATLSQLAGNGTWLDPTRPSKVTRGWVYGMMALSLPCALSNRLLRAWIARLRGHVQDAL